jgi:hypothetical protein
MPDRKHCQSVVCKGFAGRLAAKVRRGRGSEMAVPGGELNVKRVLKTRNLLKTKKREKH